MVTEISIDTQDRIRFFKRRFRSFGYGEGHYVLACHAAFPIALTPDLLYQLWANFRTYTNRIGDTQSISELAVSDLLLSSLCREVSREIFEMDVEVRAYLLEDLKEDERFGEERMQLLGNFLYQYIQEVGITLHPKSFVDAQTWTALATIAPKQAANEITKSLAKAIKERDDKEIFRMRDLLENYSNQEGAFENLLHYSKGVKAAILNYDMSVVQEQMNYSGAKILTIEEGGLAADTIVEIPLLEDLQDKVELAEEKVNTTGEQKALHRIKQELELQTGKLDLSGLELQHIPEKVFELTHLVELDLLNNELTSIPSSIQQLINLEKLLVSKNPITQLPSALQRLKVLKTFKLDEGQLTDFPTVLLKIDSLENISLEKNKLDFIPSAIADLPNLKIYDFRDNPILNIPEGLFKRTGQTIRDYFASLKMETNPSATPMVLVLTADVGGTIRKRAESNIIYDLLEIKVKKNELRIIRNDQLTLLRLFQLFQQHQQQIKILHFIFSELSLPNEKGQKILISPALLNKFLGNLTNCELIVFSGNNSADLAAFTYKNRRTACIGMGGNITDQQATNFSQNLYRNLLMGTTIKDTHEIIASKFLKNDLEQSNNPIQSKYSDVTPDAPETSLILYPPTNELDEIKKEARNLITRDNISSVFELLNQEIIKDASSHNTLITLQSRLKSEQRSYNLGLLPHNEYFVTQNQLREGLLELLNDLKESDLNVTQILSRIPFPKVKRTFNERLTQNEKPMPVLLKGAEEVINRFKKEYTTSPFIALTESEGEEIAYMLEVTASTLSIKDLKTNQLVHGIKASFGAGVEYIKTKLEALEKWHRIANLTNDSALVENEVEFIFSIEKSRNEFKEYQENEVELTYPKRGEDQESDGDPLPIWYTIKARNNSNQRLYFSLLYLSNDFGISEHFPCQEIPAQSDYLILDDDKGLIIANSNQDYSIDNFLLIVSTERFDVSRLAEDEMQLGEVISFEQANRKIQTRGGYSIRESKENQEWFTKKIKVTLKREGIDEKEVDKKSKLNLHHKYTCDRTNQYQVFTNYIVEQDNTTKFHFFGIYGGDLQSHHGLYQRFLHKVKGDDLDFKANYKSSNVIVKTFNPISFPAPDEIDTIKIGLLRELGKSLGLEDIRMEKILGKRFSYFVLASPELVNLREHHKIFLNITISEIVWDVKTTPLIIDWLINDFCDAPYPIDSPEFFFFFSFQFEEEDETMPSEIEVNLSANRKLQLLPMLDMVTKTDVRNWFDTYDILWEKKRDQKRAFEKYFGKEEEEMYMEDVEDILGRVIEEFNLSIKETPSNLSELKTELKSLVGEDKVTKALGLFKQHLRPNSSLENDLILLTNRINATYKNIKRGLISQDNSKMELNRISYALTSYIDDLEVKDVQF